MSLAGTDGLRLDQAPPLSIPATFFAAVPLAMAAAGVLLLTQGALALSSPWSLPTIALAHLGTLGILALGMTGALYQMTPVVAGTPVPAVGLARVVHVALVGGVGLLVAGFLGQPVLTWAAGALAVGFALFVAPVAVALWRAPRRTDTVWGMRLAVLSLAAVATLGVRLALGHAGWGLLPPRDLWLLAHLGTGLLGWVGGLIAAVSWQVVPMFYLAPPIRGAWWVLGGLALGLVGLWGAVAIGASAGVAAVCALPAALAVWVLHPIGVLRGLKGRRRKLVDGTARFWVAAMAAGPVALGLAVAAWLGEDPRWDVAFGWVAIWGWAGTLLHGMLARIVPFLVWFHRFSPLIGRQPVPAMRQLWPDSRVGVGLALHGSATLCGLAAIATSADLVARGTGLLVLATGLWLGWSLAWTLGRRAVVGL